jgi:hypothetical protein
MPGTIANQGTIARHACVISIAVVACGYPRPERIGEARETDAGEADARGADVPATDSGAVATCVPSPASVRARWRGENNANDDTGKFNGTLVGNVGSGAGRHGHAFVLNGTDLIKADPGDLLWPTGSFSLELWVKTFGPAGYFVEKYDHGGTATGGGQSVYHLLMNPNGTPQFEVRTAADSQASIGAPSNLINDGEWHHLVGVHDDDQGLHQLYVDGSLANQISISGNFTTPLENSDGASDPLTIGAGTVDNSATQRFWITGSIDEVAYYDAALSADEIAAIYAAPDGICH